MKTQTFLIRCEYPDGDYIPTQEFVENIQEYFAANIMDGERGRLVVKPIYQPKEEGLYKTESRIPTISELFDFVSLVKRMREAQEDCIFKSVFSTMGNTNTAAYSSAVTKRKTLEFKVDDMIKEMEDLK